MQHIYQSHIPSILNGQIQRAESRILKVKILQKAKVNVEGTCWSIYTIASISAVADPGYCR